MKKFIVLVVAILSLNVATAFASNNYEWFNAVRSGSLENVESLISSGADVNAVDYNGWTALLLASCYGNTEVAELLIANGADVNVTATNGSGSIATQSVAMLNHSLGGHAELAGGHVEHAFDEVGGAELAVLYLDSSEERYYTDTDDQRISTLSTSLVAVPTSSAVYSVAYDDGLFAGETALMHAAWMGDKTTAELLIENGADINAVDNNGSTSLDYATIALERHSNQSTEGSAIISNLEYIISLLNEYGAESKQDVN